MSNTAPSRADPVVVFPISRWCPPQETSQPHPPPQGTQEYPHFTYLISRLMNTWLPQGPEPHWAWYWCSLPGKVCAQCGFNVLKKIMQTYNHMFSLWIKLKYHICKWQISFVLQCILICSTSYLFNPAVDFTISSSSLSGYINKLWCHIGIPHT